MTMPGVGQSLQLYGQFGKGNVIKIDNTSYSVDSFTYIFQSPSLSPTDHFVNLPLSGPLMYLVAVEPGPTTPLLGEALIVDDMHSDIKFEGSGWDVAQDSMDLATSSFEGGAHTTSTVGDAIIFTFCGA